MKNPYATSCRKIHNKWSNEFLLGPCELFYTFNIPTKSFQELIILYIFPEDNVCTANQATIIIYPNKTKIGENLEHNFGPLSFEPANTFNHIM